MATFQPTSRGFICATIRIKGDKPTSKMHRTKKLAQARAQQIEDQMRSGNYHKSRDDALKVIFKKYHDEIVPLKKSQKFHKSNLNNLNSYLGDLSFNALKPAG